MKKAEFILPAGIWLALRVISSAAAAYFSALRPLESAEQQIALWPPAAPAELWLYRVWLAPWVRWDVVFFEQITRYGYAEGFGSASFHPLYTLLARWLWKFGLAPLTALWLIASLSALGFFLVTYAHQRLETSSDEARLTVLLTALFPASFILFAPYTESLFLLLAAGCFYAWRQRNPWLAGGLAFLAALTRQQGVFLFLPAAWMAWQDSGQQPGRVFSSWRWWLSSLAAPLGLLTWSAYRLFVINETPLRTDSFQAFLYSAVLSPSAQEIVPDQRMLLPWQAIWNSALHLWLFPEFQGIFNLLGGVLFVFILLAAWKNLSASEKIYSLTITLVSFSMVTGLENSFVYMSLPRHLLLAFPVFHGLARALRHAWQRWLVLAVFGLLWLFSLSLFVLHAWIP